MRTEWEKKGKCFPYIASYLFVYMPQSIFEIIIGSSDLFITIWSTPGFTPLLPIGITVWAFGFLIEVIADY